MAWLRAIALGSALVGLGCATAPPPRDAVGVSHLLPLADPAGPGESALGRCVGSLSERGALLKSCDDLEFLVSYRSLPVTSHAAPEYRRERVDASIGSRNAYLELGARYAWSVERIVTGSRHIRWRDEEEISEQEAMAVADACRGAARGGHVVVAEYHGCGVIVSSGDLSATPPVSLEEVFHARLARGQLETRGRPAGFMLLGGASDGSFDPAGASCGESATLLVKTRSLADLCLERVPGIVARKAERRRAALQSRIAELERAHDALDVRLEGCRARGEELALRAETSRQALSEAMRSTRDAAQRVAVLETRREVQEEALLAVHERLQACETGAETKLPPPEVASEGPAPEEDLAAPPAPPLDG